MLTALGGLLVPICLWFWRRPVALLMMVPIYSVFSAAALIIIGGLGITPGLLPSAIFIGVFFLNYLNGIRYPAERSVLLLLLPFILVVCGALGSSIIMPRLFENQVMVWPQKISSFFTPSLLTPSEGNITQDLYLLANALLTITAAFYLTRPGRLLSRLMDCYFWAGILVVVISIWQFMANVLHVYYPTKIFLSNPGWALLSDQSVGWLGRLNGPFSEPAALSSYMCGSISAAGWVIVNGDRRLLPKVTFWGALLVTFLTTASTGYLTLLALAGLLALRVVSAASWALRRRAAAGLLLGLVAAAVILFLIYTAAPGIFKELGLVLDGTIDKTQSSSYQARSTLDVDSLRELANTYGLGVGWGSNRSSSLLPGLCAAIGLWGVGGLVLFGLLLMRQARRAMNLTVDPELHYVIRGSAAALIANLISNLLSGPTISSPDFYLLLAMLVAATARAQHETTAPIWRGAAVRQAQAMQSA
ncbi:MAG: hypothetical protein KGQ26_02090 [Rhodospirillales bacterium]|nr:hypothetical protein [Rhodospirillales bacterium]MDE2318304.1 hypothetical protein [Rhodospirillales bacterium]